MDELAHQRKLRRRQEVDQALRDQAEDLFAWLKTHFADHPAASRSHQALIMAEVLRAAEDPENAWRLRDPAGFLAQVLETARAGLEEASRGVLDAALSPWDPPR